MRERERLKEGDSSFFSAQMDIKWEAIGIVALRYANICGALSTWDCISPCCTAPKSNWKWMSNSFSVLQSREGLWKEGSRECAYSSGHADLSFSLLFAPWTPVSYSLAEANMYPAFDCIMHLLWHCQYLLVQYLCLSFCCSGQWQSVENCWEGLLIVPVKLCHWFVLSITRFRFF